MKFDLLKHIKFMTDVRHPKNKFWEDQPVTFTVVGFVVKMQLPHKSRFHRLLSKVLFGKTFQFGCKTLHLIVSVALMN